MQCERLVEITNKYGLHARASTRLAQRAKEFQCAVSLSRLDHDEEIDAKSILGILTLGLERGKRLRIRTEGVDAQDAMEAIVKLIQDNFDEE